MKAVGLSYKWVCYKRDYCAVDTFMSIVTLQLFYVFKETTYKNLFQKTKAVLKFIVIQN